VLSQQLARFLLFLVSVGLPTTLLVGLIRRSIRKQRETREPDLPIRRAILALQPPHLPVPELEFAALAASSMPPTLAAHSRAIANGYPLDHRGAVRREGNPTLIELDIGGGTPYRGWVLNRSTTGLRLACRAPANIGARIMVRSRQYTEPGPWVALQVQNCTRHDDESWILGCRFIEQQQWNVLLLFG
jgi:hypothetical protein